MSINPSSTIPRGGGSSTSDAAAVYSPSDEPTPEHLATFAALTEAPLAGPTGLANLDFVYFDNPLDQPTTPPPANPSASSPPAPSDPPHTLAGNAGGSTSLVVVPPSPPSTNAPQAPSTPPPVVPPPSSLPIDPPSLPHVNDDSYTVTGGTLTVSAANGLLANDTNPTGQPMTVSFVNPPVIGSLSVNADGSFLYTNNNPGLTQSVTFSYLATAGGLGSNTATVTLNIVTPPTIIDPGPQAVAEGQAVSLGISASVPGGTTTYAAVNLPAGLGIDSATGVISGNVDYAAAENFGGTYASTIIVADGLGDSATTQLTWTVTDTAQPPVLANPGDQASNTGEPVSVQLSGSSPDGNTLAYSAAGLPSGLGIDVNSGAITGSIDHSAPPINIVTVTATDTKSGLTASQTFAWAVTPTSHAPTLDPIADQTNAAGDAVDLWANGSSVDGSPLTYSATGLPSGLVIDPLTGEITGTIASTAYSPTPYQVTVTASDGTSSASQRFAWNVGAIQFTIPSDQSGAIGSVVSFQVSGQDLSGGTLSYSATGLPPGLTIDPATGLITGTITAGPTWQGNYTVTVTGTDGTYTSGPTFGWNVTPATDATAPTITDPGAQTGTAGTSAWLQITATSPAGALVYSAAGLPIGLSIDPASGLINGTLTNDDVGTATVTVTVTDPLGGTASDTFTWVVSPAPVTVTANALTAPAGHGTGNVVVAAFTTTDPTARASDYAAMIDWGDGNTDQGVIVGGGGVFTVTSDHTYGAAGSYALNVTVTLPDYSTASAGNTATVTASTPSNTTGGRTLAMQGSDVKEDDTGYVATQLVATVEDSNPTDKPSDFVATVVYDDGSSDAGTITGGGGLFQVFVQHAFAVAAPHVAHILWALATVPTVTLVDTDIRIVDGDYTNKFTNVATPVNSTALNGYTAQATFVVTYGRYYQKATLVGPAKYIKSMALTLAGTNVQTIEINGTKIIVPKNLLGQTGTAVLPYTATQALTTVKVWYRRSSSTVTATQVSLTASIPKTIDAVEAGDSITAVAKCTFQSAIFNIGSSSQGLTTVVAGAVGGNVAAPIVRQFYIQAAAGVNLNNDTLRLEAVGGTPADQADLVLGNITQGGSVEAFTLQGVSPTAATAPGGAIPNVQWQLVLRDNATSAVLARADVVVVKPAGISKVHPQADSPVQGVNRTVNIGTSPAFPNTPIDRMSRITSYAQWLPIQVVDQFGQPLDGVFAGQNVFETTQEVVNPDTFNINQPLRADGSYLDPVGPYLGPNATIAANDAQGIAAWLSRAVEPPPAQDSTQNITVLIAGWQLDPSVVGRRVICTPTSATTARVQIIWP